MLNRGFTRGGELPVALSRAFSSDERFAKEFSSLEPAAKRSLLSSPIASMNSSQLSAYMDTVGTSGNNMSYDTINV